MSDLHAAAEFYIADCTPKSMTDEQLTEQTIAAFRACKADPSVKIEFIYMGLGSTGWQDAISTPWMSGQYHYRIKPKPAPATRPWSKPEDVPFPWPIIRIEALDGIALITGIRKTGIMVASIRGQEIPWCDINAYQHSTDGRTWLPCEVTV